MNESLEPVNGGWSLRGFKGKGGGDSRQPVESPDSLHSTSYARVLDLVSEGEIAGLVDGLRSIYLNDTPLQNADNSLNFMGVQADFRAGTQWQDHIAGFPAAETTVPVGVELRASLPWVRAIGNAQLSAVRVMLGVDGLSQTSTSTGDVTGFRVEYAIDLATAGGAWVEVLVGAFDGKATSSYRRSHRIDLPPSASGWSIRVRRLTADTDSITIADTTVIDSISEVIDAKLRHPMSALVGIQVDASQFNSVPTRAYRMRGRIVRVPANYNAETRVYTGTWDGTFQLAYTNNPAWVFYDIVVNDRYGLGQQVPAAWMDKWSLYQIGRYCDESIPDGMGGTEPRFTTNLYLQSRAHAYKVLQDMASVFRGMSYWATGAVVPVADMPRDPVYTYTGANVIDARFVYGGSGRKTRYSVALVSYNDMEDMGRAKVVAVQDDAAVVRYGIRITEVTAFGCTSKSQAYRLGKWLLLTSMRETRTVAFSVGLDGTVCAPGQVIRVADSSLAGRRIGGRIHSATATEITVDAEIGVRPGDRLTVVLPSGVTETRDVSHAVGLYVSADKTTITVDSTEITADMIGFPGMTLTITVTASFSEVPEAESVWALDSEDLSTQLFSVVSVTEGDGLTFDVAAVQHEPGKFSAIDYGTLLENPPITVVPASVQPPPTAVAISSYNVIWQGASTQTAMIAWEPAAGAIAYEVEWRRDNSQWVKAGRTGAALLEVPNIYAGTYRARVRAINAADIPSTWASSAETILNGIVGAPPVVSSLTTTSIIFGIRLNWVLPTTPGILQRTEVWYGTTNVLSAAIKLADFATPQDTHTLMGLAAGSTLYFWARLVDKNGTVGDFFPSGAGVQGTASSDPAQILEYLAGQISETQLAELLLAKIQEGADSLVQVEEVTTALAAMWAIKTQLTVGGVPYMAGIGVGVENDEGGITSQILLAAQRIAVLDEVGGVVATPFVIQGGQVFMNAAFISSASIGTAQIADAAITRAKIGALAVGSAEIEDAAIKSAKIDNAAVGTLKLAGNSVSTMSSVGGTSGTISTNIYVPAGMTMRIVVLGHLAGMGDAFGFWSGITGSIDVTLNGTVLGGGTSIGTGLYGGPEGTVSGNYASPITVIGQQDFYSAAGESVTVSAVGTVDVAKQVIALGTLR